MTQSSDNPGKQAMEAARSKRTNVRVSLTSDDRYAHAVRVARGDEEVWFGTYDELADRLSRHFPAHEGDQEVWELLNDASVLLTMQHNTTFTMGRNRSHDSDKCIKCRTERLLSERKL